MNADFINGNRKDKTSKFRKLVGAFNSATFAWVLLVVWVGYSAMVLFHFKDQQRLNVFVCKVLP